MLNLFDRSAEMTSDHDTARLSVNYGQECVVPSTVSQVLMMMEDPRQAMNWSTEQGCREAFDQRLGR